MVVDYSVSDGLGRVTLNRPRVHNALNREAKTMLASIWGDADRNPEVRAVLISGRGPSFCSGSDLQEIRDSGPADDATVLGALPGMLTSFSKPIVASLHGHVLGMGFNLALHCDLRVAAPDAQFGFPEIRVGMMSAAGSVALSSFLGPGRALEILMLGEPISVGAALDMGLINRIADDPLAFAEAWALELVELDPTALAAIRMLVHRSESARIAVIDEIRRARSTLQNHKA